MGVVVLTCNPGMQEAETEGSRPQPWQHGTSKANVGCLRFSLKKETVKSTGNNSEGLLEKKKEMEEGRPRESMAGVEGCDQRIVYMHMNMSQWNLFFCAINMC